LLIAVDRFGQVFVAERTGKLVCVFLVVRGSLAAWMPDGTRFGLAGAIGGPPTPGARERIGEALLEAWLRNEETTV
jgi:hypothetical protein